MKFSKPFLVALALAIAVPVLAEIKTLVVTPPTEREDGSALPSEEIAGYRLQCQVNGGEWAQIEALAGEVTQHDFAPGQWECRAYTVDTLGQESVEAGLSGPFVVTPARPREPGLAVQ